MPTTPEPASDTAALSRVRRYAVPVLRVAAVLVGVMLVLLLGLRVARAGALPGVQLAGRDVSGLKAAQLHDIATELARERADTTVTVVRAPVPEAGATDEAEVTATGGELGYGVDVDATVDRVLRRGRQLNPFAALYDQLHAFVGTIPVELVQQIDDERFGAWSEDALERLRVEPVEGSLAFEGTTVARVEPKPGAAVRPDALRSALQRVLYDGEPGRVSARTRPVEPLTTPEDVDAVEADARQALSAPVLLRRDEATITLAPEDIAAILEVERVSDGDDASLRLRVSPTRLRGRIPDEVMSAIERDPVDATFEVSAGSVSVVPSQDGFAFDADAAAEQVTELAMASADRDAELTGEVTEPELTTERAERLGITEQVSTFTTRHDCCQSRVTNIQRMADLVDGVVIEPGETFSLNGHVGERTVAKGFAPGGAIYDGQFVEQIGGGVSQFTTTMFNAAFFGGYAIPDYKPHSYYISRYPVGREATLNWPNVDLKILNNAEHGVLVKTSYTATSITVTFYGTKWVEVGDVTGPRSNVKPPPTRYEENPALPPGEERVVSSGREGFDIVVTRILTFPNGTEERERFFTRYLPEPRVVQRNSAGASPDEPPPDEPPPDEPPPDEPPPDPEPTP